MFHIHKWSAWTVRQETSVLRPATVGRAAGIIGYAFIQSRTCTKCGFTQYNKQQINAN